MDNEHIELIKKRRAACPSLDPYVTGRGGVVLINGPFKMEKAVDAALFVQAAPSDVDYLLAENERMRKALALILDEAVQFGHFYIEAEAREALNGG